MVRQKDASDEKFNKKQEEEAKKTKTRPNTNVPREIVVSRKCATCYSYCHQQVPCVKILGK